MLNGTIGIMQGRLSPPLRGRIQAFPVSNWDREFDLAAQASLDYIEWIYEFESEKDNPLGSDKGVEAIRKKIDRTGVCVRSICADCYMERRIIDTSGSIDDEMAEHLIWLTGQGYLLGVSHIVLPFVDSSALRTEKEKTALGNVLATVLSRIEKYEIQLHLETDIEPAELGRLLKYFSHPLLRANYDIGNSASLARDPELELIHLGPFLGSVHVKDRLLHGTTVPLGTGNADMLKCFKLFKQWSYTGFYILQAARQNNITEVELAGKNREFVIGLINEAESDQ